MAGLGLATSILFSACTAQKNVNAFVTTADQSMVFKEGVSKQSNWHILFLFCFVFQKSFKPPILD